ncbi:uncharacterized protein TRIVIDRAFT_140208 [Trichoderma virens Gv29-8]|uniref:Uncharacterized protein n=1 Tax=Hypocrea virens (strain Gv29-8 / FGSC 10586) TaxID=413071 RepID=G9MEA3_HYPVG|nr:uncharacterized protein TRIVIDRAFT_140208 [Trichoderma virens Gv29-8]EHK27395.1 hypothetical protein TRIVIDRAFT_140208 [Trichoderma virens Gv29-8]
MNSAASWSILISSCSLGSHCEALKLPPRKFTPTPLAAEDFNERKNTKIKRQKMKETYNSRCSPVVTHLTTNLPLISLTVGERTGSRIF